MKLTELYESILRFCGMEADSEGFVSTVLDDKRHPSLIGGKRLVLPTDSHLRNPKEKLIFHPLSENIMRGESEVITALRDVINIRLNFTFGIVCQYLLNLIASPDDHSKLSPEQMELLIGVKDVDDITVRNFISLMVEGVKQDASRVFTNIYLRRGGTIGDKRYSRIGVVMFDFYAELCKEGNTIYGVKLRVKDKEAYKQLCRFIFPCIEETGYYNRGSDSDIAPFLDALMKSAMGVAARFNDILDMYRDFIDEADKLYFDSDWTQTFENLGVMLPEIRRVPVQAGNEGAVKREEVKNVEITRPELPSPPQQIQQLPPSTTQVTASAHSQYQQNMQPAINQQHSQQVVKTDAGLDWNSVKMMNVGLNMQPNPLGNQFMMNQMQMQQQMQQQRTPSWAMPASAMMNNGMMGGNGMFNNSMFNNGMMNNGMMNNGMMGGNGMFNNGMMGGQQMMGGNPFFGNQPAMRR